MSQSISSEIPSAYAEKTLMSNNNKGIIKGPGGFRSWRPSGDHPNYYIIENSQNTEKSPGDLRRLAVTQTPGKDHQLMLM